MLRDKEAIERLRKPLGVGHQLVQPNLLLDSNEPQCMIHSKALLENFTLLFQLISSNLACTVGEPYQIP